jgi:hypothetical protein
MEEAAASCIGVARALVKARGLHVLSWDEKPGSETIRVGGESGKLQLLKSEMEAQGWKIWPVEESFEGRCMVFGLQSPPADYYRPQNLSAKPVSKIGWTVGRSMIACAALLLSIPVAFGVLFMIAPSHHLNFFPSSRWTTMSIELSIGLTFAFSTLFFISDFKRVDDGIKTIDKRAVMWMVLCSLVLYGLFAYGIGLTATALSYTTVETVERDIEGIKTKSCGRGGCNFYIKTDDLPEGIFAQLYITESEFNSIPQEVRMHVTLKRSFFGMAVQRYTFLLKDGKTVYTDRWHLPKRKLK